MDYLLITKNGLKLIQEANLQAYDYAGWMQEMMNDGYDIIVCASKEEAEERRRVRA